MKTKLLFEAEQEDLILLVADLKEKLKRKSQNLTTARLRLTKAKNSIQRLQGIVTYQRERILELYQEQVPITREIINTLPHDQKLF